MDKNLKRKISNENDFESESEIHSSEEFDEETDEESDEEDIDEEDSGEDLESDSESGSIRDIKNIIDLKDISDDDDDHNHEDVIDSNDNDELFTQISNKGNNFDVQEKNQNTKKDVKSIKNDIVPVSKSHNLAHVDEYNYDSSDEEDVLNTIGNIPYEWYKDYIHIGYDVDGKKIVKPSGNQVEEFLDQMNDPNYWRIVKDNLTGQKVILSDEHIELVKRIRKARCPDPEYNQYEPFIDFFSYKKMIHPVTNRPEPKAAFIPSISEKRIVSKLVSAIKKARLKPKPLPKKPRQFEFSYDLWEKDGEKSKRLDRYIPPPRMQPPGHEESYNPPPEYLFTEEEEKEWLEQEPEERKTNFIPRSYRSLREVPAYSNFIKERFDRSLDLYLCPRIRKNRIQVNPEDLIPQLPKPSDLQPFPSVESIVYLGHSENVLCISVEHSGQFMVSGDKSGVVKAWEVLTGRCLKTLQFSAPIKNLCWYPTTSKSILAILIGNDIKIINIGLGEAKIVRETDKYFADLTAENEVDEDSIKDKSICQWRKIDQNSDEWDKGVRLVIEHSFELKQFTWHSAGQYFSIVMAHAGNKSVVIHHLTKMKSQVPFKKIKDIVQIVQFHPTKAFFFVASKRSIRVYDLIKQQMTKKLLANCNEISCMAIHPGGDNLIVGSLDPRVQWFDMDLSDKPYKTMRYHKKSVRSVDFHQRYPLFASSSDDGTVAICHGMVFDDLIKNPLIVPVKVLKAQNVKKNNEVPQCIFHPYRPWLFAISNETIRLFS